MQILVSGFDGHIMALSKYESTRDTTNFARVARMILGPCTGVLQEILKEKIPLTDFKHTVKTFYKNLPKHKQNTISEKQILEKFALSGSYSNFDITFLYYLLRNLCSIHQHTNKWGNVPNRVDRSLSANIERIRVLRNEYGHSTQSLLSVADFEQKVKDIHQIVRELESYLGTATDKQEAVLKLKTCCMDPEHFQISNLEGNIYF